MRAKRKEGREVRRENREREREGKNPCEHQSFKHIKVYIICQFKNTKVEENLQEYDRGLIFNI